MLYDLLGHSQMISDPVRMGAYARALQQTVRPGSVVVDLGAGTGVFALLACRLGARRVYAIEQDDVIEVARQLAAGNDSLERIQFFQGDSKHIHLPEQADVIVSDLRDILPWFRQHIPVIADARRRFLKPGGVLIPQCDTVWAAPVHAPELYRRPPASWDGLTHGFDLGLVWQFAANSYARARVKPEQLLAPPQQFATLDYTRIDNPNVSAQIAWKITSAGAGHGFVAWFDTVLAEGVRFSNSPAAPQAIYGSLFFPWQEPLDLQPGDEVLVNLQGNLIHEEYVWKWDTLRDKRGTAQTIFKQSAFYGTAFSPANLRKFASDHAPVLNDDGAIDQRILALMDGCKSVDEIARHVAREFPEKFPHWEDALTRVGMLSHRYSR